MKKYIVTATIAAVLTMISAPAMAQTSGTVGVNYARADTGGGDTDAFGVSGGVTIPMSGSLALLLDGSWSTNDDANTDVLAGTAHLIVRDSDMAWGGFVGIAKTDSGAVDADAIGFGGEFAKFLDTSTIAVSAGYATNDDANVDVTGITGEYRIFASDNLRFDLGAGFAQIDAGGGDGNGTQVGAGVEYRFAGSPFSLGANISHRDSDFGDADVIGATLRFDFGNDSLKSRDRNSNTFGQFGGLSSFF